MSGTYFVLFSMLYMLTVAQQNTVLTIGVLATEGMNPTSLFQLAADYVNYTSTFLFSFLLFSCFFFFLS